MEFIRINSNAAIPKITLEKKTKVSFGAQKKDEFVKSEGISKNKTPDAREEKITDPRRKKLFAKIEKGMKERGLEKYTDGVLAFFEMAQEDDIAYLEQGNNLQEFLDNDLSDTDTIKALSELYKHPLWGKFSYNAVCALTEIKTDEVSLVDFLEDIKPEDIDTVTDYISLRKVKKGDKLKNYIKRAKIFEENVEKKEGIAKNTVKELIGNKELDDEFLEKLFKMINKKTQEGKLLINDDFSKVKAENKGLLFEYMKNKVKVCPYDKANYFHNLGLEDFKAICELKNKFNTPVIEKMLSYGDYSLYEMQNALCGLKKDDVEVALKNMEMFHSLGLNAIEGVHYRGEEIKDTKEFRENLEEFPKIFRYTTPPSDILASVCQTKQTLDYAKLMNNYSVGVATISAAIQNNAGADDIEIIKGRLDEILNHPSYRNENFAWIPYAIKNKESFNAFKTFEEILIGKSRENFSYFEAKDRKIFALKYDDPKKVQERMKKITKGYDKVPFAIMATSDEAFNLSKKAEEKFKNKELSNTIFSYELTKGKQEKIEELYKKAEFLFDTHKIRPIIISELLEKGNYDFALDMLKAGVDKNFIKNTGRLRREVRDFEEEKTIKALLNYQKFGEINSKDFEDFIFKGYYTLELLLDEKKMDVTFSR